MDLADAAHEIAYMVRLADGALGVMLEDQFYGWDAYHDPLPDFGLIISPAEGPRRDHFRGPAK